MPITLSSYIGYPTWPKFPFGYGSDYAPTYSYSDASKCHILTFKPGQTSWQAFGLNDKIQVNMTGKETINIIYDLVGSVVKAW